MSAAAAAVAGADEAIPKRRFDLVPIALLAGLALVAWPAVGSTSTWLTLTLAGLAMGMIVFIAASGLTLVFGLMDVLNFGHSLFIALGAYIGASVLAQLSGWTGAASLAPNLAAVFCALLAAMTLAGVVGVGFERVIVRPVYGQHLKQILVTLGGAIVGEELIKAVWGPAQIAVPPPEALRGSILIGEATVDKLRLVSVAIGIVVLAALLWTLNRTKIGLLIRAGVQDREMVESLGYRIRRLFVGVFAAGSALAGLGGTLWGMNQQIVVPQIGGQVNVLIFIVIIMGGLGSTLGCLIGALLVGLLTNYVGFLTPKLATFSSIGLMVAVLLWRPQGLYSGHESLAMWRRLLSHDLPKNRWLALVLVGIVVALALTPFLFPGTKALNVAAKVIVFIVLAASFDLLLGYTGIVSFAHTMFFGIGAYGVAIASTRLGPTWPALGLGVAAALATSLVLSVVIGLFSLRVRAIFFAMITLAVASAFATLASQLSELTGGEDGLSFKVPEALQPATSYAAEPFLGAAVDGRLLTYYLVFVAALLLVLALLRIVNSPFGRVLQAIRENDFRAEAIGYRTVVYRTVASVVSALFATLAGVLLALWLRYNGPDTTLSFEIMLDVLLIVVIGGMGTMYGAVIGSVLLVLAQNYLQDLMKLAAGAVADVPVLDQLVAPERWLLWLGLLFVLSVYFFPSGVVGRLRSVRRAKPTPAKGSSTTR